MRNNVDITFHPSWWYKHTGVEFDEKFWFDTDYRIEADIVMRRKLYEYFGDFGIGEKEPAPRPILFSDLLACGFLYSQILGCEVLFERDNAPQVLSAKLTGEQIRFLQPIDLDNSPIWQKIQQQIDELQSKFGYVESAINLMGIQNIALDLLGEELFLYYYDDESDLHTHLLDVITQLSLDIGKRLYAVSNVVSGGVTSIIKQTCPDVYLTSNCTVAMISNDLYCEKLLSYDIQLAKAFPCFGIHHCGSNMENVIEGYLQVPNLRFLEIGAGSNYSEIAKSIAGKNIISCIRYSPVTLKTDTAESMAKRTEEAILAFGSDEKLCFSCVGIDKDVDVEKIRQYLHVFRRRKNEP
ncbi:MAG: hypothetical protein E7658_09445 [Ruminococcaceae bacterium]|nr:hypothetical protein [Oscillospiraceae bacterium]